MEQYHPRWFLLPTELLSSQSPAGTVLALAVSRELSRPEFRLSAVVEPVDMAVLCSLLLLRRDQKRQAYDQEQGQSRRGQHILVLRRGC